MAKYNNVLETIGKTPLIRLNKLAKNIKSDIYVKVEAYNPGGSVKDRVGVKMIELAEKNGILKPGGTIIEATAGNTGVGLAIVAAIKGYRTIFVLPDKMSQEKVNILKAYGAEVIIAPSSVPPDSPESYNGVAERLAREIPNSFRPDQFGNPNNPKAHYLTTGPEIWEDSEGKVDVLVAGIGTGGTISGTGKYLKEKKPEIIVIGADPEGSILSGDTPKPYKVEGIGEDFIPSTFNRQIVDKMIRIGDKESFLTARLLAKQEGILAGGSSGTALAAALQFAKATEESKFIVVILPDTGRNYLSKVFDDNWLKENNLLEENLKSIKELKKIVESKNVYYIPLFISVKRTDPISLAVKLLCEYNISQIPVTDENGDIVGCVSEIALIKYLMSEHDLSKESVSIIMGNPLPVLSEEMDVAEAYRLFLAGAPALIIRSKDRSKAVITRADLINYFFR